VALARSGANAIARWRELTFRSPNDRLPRIVLDYRLENRAVSETFEPEFNYGRPSLDLSGAMLSGSKLAGADFSHDNLLSGADLTGSDLHLSDLSGANLHSAHLWRSNISRANLAEAQMSGCSLGRTNLASSTLRMADLKGADLSYADLSYANLEGANLSGANLTETDLSWANLTNAVLRGAVLTASSLRMADLTGADLRGARVTKAGLDSTVLYKTVLGVTLFANCDLSTVIGLEFVDHAGPTTIALDTLARSGGRIPRTFLEGAGVAEPLIGMQDAMNGGPRTYPTVLLIGSKEDEGLASRLRAGLAQAKIPSWTIAADDEDAIQSGAVSLDQVVYYDRLVLLCTRSSLENPLTSRYFAELVRSHGRSSTDSMITLGADGLFYQREDRLCNRLRRGLVMDFRGWEEDTAYGPAFESLVQTLSTGATT
jgi:uncharacterized protein YjbI with pentapeptide repeats